MPITQQETIAFCAGVTAADQKNNRFVPEQFKKNTHAWFAGYDYAKNNPKDRKEPTQ